MIQTQMVKVIILSLANTNKNDLIFLFSENGGSSDEDLPPSKRLKT